MLTRNAGREFAPIVIVNCSCSFLSSIASRACAQYANDALSFVTNSSFGHFALTVSGVDVSFASRVAFAPPRFSQK